MSAGNCTCSAGSGREFPAQHATMCPRFGHGDRGTMSEHHSNCYQRTGVPDDMPATLCDCRVLRMIADDVERVERPLNLTEFLLARIAEDELAWSGKGRSGWLAVEHPLMVARMLAECEAKRGLLTFALEHGASIDGEFGCCHSAEDLRAGGRGPDFDGDEFDPLPHDCPGIKAAMPGLHLLALPYADHPDYREEWKP